MNKWDEAARAFENVAASMKDAEGEHGTVWRNHAEVMLKLIPQIRDLPELADFELTFSLGRLLCVSTSKRAKLYLSSDLDRYFVEIHPPLAGVERIEVVSPQQIVPYLQASLKTIYDR